MINLSYDKLLFDFETALTNLFDSKDVEKMLLQLMSEKYPYIKKIYGPMEIEVHSITYDSRDVGDFSAFFCIKGTNYDGHTFIEQAIGNGATVIIGTNHEILSSYHKSHPSITFVGVDDAQKAVSYFSSEFYHHSYKNLQTIAVTGTNGKTTVTSFVHQLLNHYQLPTGLIGSDKVRDDKQIRDFPHSTHTTPEAPDLHYIFDTFVNEGVEAVALEVTSIAITQKRVEGLQFDVGVHTNLTPDHLDFHKTFEHYKQAKLQMFQQVKRAVVNIDDIEMGEDIIKNFSGPLLSYSMNKEADVSGKLMAVDEKGTALDIKVLEESYSLYLPFFGKHNMYNFLAALCSCILLDIPVQKVLDSASLLKTPNGRLDFMKTGTNFKIISDFAHTPDALENIIKTVKSMKYRKLILLVAGSGVRDPKQLPLIAQAARQKADHLIITVEHPNYFERKNILDDMMSCFQAPHTENITAKLHREDGIYEALSLAEEGDIVLLTGLGAVDHQVILGKNVPYSEVDVINKCLKSLDKVYYT